MQNRIHEIKIEFYWLSCNRQRQLKDSMYFTSKVHYKQWLNNVEDYVEITNII